MAPQTVLITGCSSGIGLATAVRIAKETQHDFKVYATMRNLDSRGKLEAAAGDTLNKTLFIRALDVTTEATIFSVVGEILRENGRIDVLINNAGYSTVDCIDQIPLEKCQAVMDTNYWGVVRTIRAVLPAMKKQRSGRILNVSSIVGILAAPFFATYSSSKYAVEGFAESIAPTLRTEYNIRVSIVEPGPISTSLPDSVHEELYSNIADIDDNMVKAYKAQMRKMAARLAPLLQSPEEVAQLHLDIILNPDPHLRYQSSQAITDMAGTKLRDVAREMFMCM